MVKSIIFYRNKLFENLQFGRFNIYIATLASLLIK